MSDPTGYSEPPPARVPLPVAAQAERDAIVHDIHNAFGKVTRGGGISWSECEALDRYATEEECERARRTDRDTRWFELVDDSKWQPFPGIGGFSFIDAIGFRYYLPPTMIRFLRGDVSHWFPEHLPGVIERYSPRNFENHLGGRKRPAAFWTPAQLRCIARFMCFMSRHDPTGWADEDSMSAWRDALDNGWRQHLDTET